MCWLYFFYLKLFFPGDRGGVIAWDSTSCKRIKTKFLLKDPISAFNISSDGKFLALYVLFLLSVFFWFMLPVIYTSFSIHANYYHWLEHFLLGGPYDIGFSENNTQNVCYFLYNWCCFPGGLAWPCRWCFYHIYYFYYVSFLSYVFPSYCKHPYAVIY